MVMKKGEMIIDLRCAIRSAYLLLNKFTGLLTENELMFYGFVNCYIFTCKAFGNWIYR